MTPLVLPVLSVVEGSKRSASKDESWNASSSAYGKALQLSVNIEMWTQTKWYVITGAPCSGKTSVILELERRGFCVVHEAARAYIDEQRALGLTLDEIKSDISCFEHQILCRKVDTEIGLSPDETVFFDRGIPDSMAYFNIEGLDDTVPMKESRRYCYRAVFLFDRLTFETDAARSEDDHKAARLEALLKDRYRSLGYTPIPIPVVPIEQRVQLVLSYVKKAES